MSRIILVLTLLASTSGYLLPVRQQLNKVSNYFVKTIEPQLISANSFIENKTQCLFYTGGGSEIPGELYTSFLNKLAEQNLTVHIVNRDIKKNHILLRSITNDEPTTIISHSSGAAEAMESCNQLENVNKLVLIDPVDSRFLTTNIFNYGSNKEFDFYYQSLDNVLILNADKSYRWRFFPPRIPFIPFFNINPKIINIENKAIVSAHDYGHCDILDYPWGKIMHETISEGIENRNEDIIDTYHNWMARVIAGFIRSNEIIRDRTIKNKIR